MKIKSVSNNLRDLRFKYENMSQQKLADLVGCTRQTIIALEQNKYSPSFILVVKIAKVFRVKPSEVIIISLEE